MNTKILGSLLILGLTGCSNFQSQWRKTPLTPGPEGGIAGRWEGTWLSDSSSHTDKLRCLITHEEGPRYEAFFRAKYKKILTFTYKMRLEVKPGTIPTRFEGAADLGKLAGGEYTYDGFATSTNFYCTYNSKYDHGTFQMTRPPH